MGRGCGWVTDADADRCGGGWGQMLRQKKVGNKLSSSHAKALLAAVATTAAAATIVISGAKREGLSHRQAAT